MSLDPDLETMRRLGHDAIDAMVEHLAHLRDRRVANRWTAADHDAVLREPLPRAGRGEADSLRRFVGVVLPRCTLVNHPRFFAYVPGPGSFAGALGAWLAAASNLFVGTSLGGAALARLELQALEWLREALGLPPGSSGIVTSGGSLANLCALAAARTRVDHGPKAVVYADDQAHYSVGKAARVLGMRTHVVAVGDRGALRAAVAQDRASGLAPCCVVATAGTTNTGAIDPLAAIANVAAELELWLHVDGAYGAAAAVLPEWSDLRAGLALADSVTLDPHKWLCVPFECGCVLTRHVGALRAAFAADDSYMQDIPRDEVNFFERGPELTRGARALKLWFTLRSLGLDAIGQAIRQDIALAARACARLRADPRIEIVTEPSLSTFTFALAGGEPAGRKLFDALLRDGFALLSTSRVRDRFVLRWCVVNHRTTADDVDATVDRVLALL
jgi:glutamate/tyrosine decarboxylase-like PLP-dependent enzyme